MLFMFCSFFLAGYGCMTCIGNSGPLPEPVHHAIEQVLYFIVFFNCLFVSPISYGLELPRFCGLSVKQQIC